MASFMRADLQDRNMSSRDEEIIDTQSNAYQVTQQINYNPDGQSNSNIQYQTQLNRSSIDPNANLIMVNNQESYDQLILQKLNQSQSTIDIVWTKTVKSIVDQENQRIGGGMGIVNNNGIQGFISKENPRKHLVYANNILKVIDVSQSQKGMQVLEVPYVDKELVYSSFKGDYLITNYLVPKTNQSFLEVKRLSTKDHNLKQFSQDMHNQLSAQSIQQQQLSTHDYIACQLLDGVAVSKVHVLQYYGQFNGQQNVENLREILIILRRNSNTIEIKEIKHNENQIINLNVIMFEEFKQNYEYLKIEDFKIIDDKIIINFDNQFIYFFGVEDLLRQSSDKFNSALCQKIEKFDIMNENSSFKIASVEYFMFQQNPLLIVTKESQNPEIAHQLEVYNYNYIQNIKVLDLIPSFSKDIEHTQEYQELLNLDQVNNSYLHKGSNLLTSVFQPHDVILRGQTRKILDTLSTEQAFYILAKEGRSIILYMIDRFTSDIFIQQVNQGQLLKGENKLIDELIGARLVQESIDQQPEGVQVDIMMLSQNGSQITQLRINQGKSKLIQEYSQLDRQTLRNIPKSTNYQTGLFAQSDPILKMQSKVETSLELVEQLINLSQYKKLAEYVLMKTNDREENYIFEEIGALQIIMQNKIDQQRIDDTAQLLSAAKHFQINYNPNYTSQVQFKKSLEQDISIQILRLEGYQTVFSAIIKREIETIKSNQIKTGETLESNRDNISRIQRFVIEKLEKQANFMKLLLFMVQSEFLPTIYQLQVDPDQIHKIARDVQQEGTCLQALMKSTAPDLLNYYPLIEIEQYVSLFDQSVLPEKPLTIIYYHILEFQQLKQANNYNYPDLKPYFQQHLSHLISSQLQIEIEALWTLDHLELQHLFANQAQICTEIIAKLLKSRKFLSLDHLVVQKLIAVGQTPFALDFINQGGCGQKDQLNNENILNLIVQLFLSQNKYQQALSYLKQNEDIINYQLYENQMQILVKTLIQTNQIQNGLFSQSLSEKQKQIIEEYIQQNHPDLLLSLNVFQRNLIKGLAQDLTQQSSQSQSQSQFNLQGSMLNVQQMLQQQNNKAQDLKSLLHINYLAAIGDDRRQAVFQATNQPASQIDYLLSEKQSQYSANMKFKIQGSSLAGSAFANKFSNNVNETKTAPIPQIQFKNTYGNKLSELKSKFMADPFFSSGGQQQQQQQQNKQSLMDFFKVNKQSQKIQEESKIINKNEDKKNEKVMRSFGMIGQIDEPFTYKEDEFSQQAKGIFPIHIKDYDYLYQEQLRQSLSPNKSQMRSSLTKSMNPNRLNINNNDVYIPNIPTTSGGGLGLDQDLLQQTHDDLLRDTSGDMLADLAPHDDIQDYDEDDIAQVQTNIQGNNRMTAAFGTGDQQQQQIYGDIRPQDNINNVSRDQRSVFMTKNLSTIHESIGESYTSNLGGPGDYNASNLSNILKTTSQQKVPQRYSMDQRSSSAMGASGNNPFGNASAISGSANFNVNIRSGSGVIGKSGDTQSLNLQKSELLYQEEEDVHVGHLGFQDDEDLLQDNDEQQQLQYEYDQEQFDDDEDDRNYPNESPEQRKARRLRNFMMRKQAEDVSHQKGFKIYSNTNRQLTRSEAKRINMQPDEHIELTPAHKK